MRRDTRLQTVCVGSHSRVDGVPGWYPENDGDSIHRGEDLRAYNEAFKELREAYRAPSDHCAGRPEPKGRRQFGEAGTRRTNF